MNVGTLKVEVVEHVTSLDELTLQRKRFLVVLEIIFQLFSIERGTGVGPCEAEKIHKP